MGQDSGSAGVAGLETLELYLSRSPLDGSVVGIGPSPEDYRKRETGVSERWREVGDLLEQSYKPWHQESFHHTGHELFYLLATSTAWMALASVLRAWIDHKTARNVVVHGSDGKFPSVGQLPASEIESLVRTLADQQPDGQGNSSHIPDDPP